MSEAFPDHFVRLTLKLTGKPIYDLRPTAARFSKGDSGILPPPLPVRQSQYLLCKKTANEIGP